MESLLKNSQVLSLIDLAFEEDIGEGDHTSLACIDTGQKGTAVIVAKESGILAGIDLTEFIFHKMDIGLAVEKFFRDGQVIRTNEVLMKVYGSSISMLTAERTALNFIQRLSGIATQTNQYVQQLRGTKAKIIDTRKTTPGMRLLEKWAVKQGGGENHRIGLFDMILIKDNHIDFAGGIKNAIKRTMNYLKQNNLNIAVEIETRSIADVKEVISFGSVQRIMLDNFSPEKVREAVSLINNKFETEASGGITLENLRTYATTGVDYISSGALTHSIKSLDLSMKVSLG
ncbi:MAG: carboxylating nicotinate-nucleotide diphosphorylase [Bacteroidia bacterium]